MADKLTDDIINGEKSGDEKTYLEDQVPPQEEKKVPEQKEQVNDEMSEPVENQPYTTSSIFTCPPPQVIHDKKEDVSIKKEEGKMDEIEKDNAS